jgi:hypothetical protein
MDEQQGQPDGGMGVIRSREYVAYLMARIEAYGLGDMRRSDWQMLAASHAALLDALAAREAEVAELKDAIERVDRDANKRGEHTRQGAPSQAHSFTRGMKYAISVIRDYDDPRIDFPALAAPPPGDGAGGGEA